MAKKYFKIGTKTSKKATIHYIEVVDKPDVILKTMRDLISIGVGIVCDKNTSPYLDMLSK